MPMRVSRFVSLALLLFPVPLALAKGPTKDSQARARYRMVEEEIVAAGVKNGRVIRSMKQTLRHEFVPLRLRKYAYLDMALPIGESQTISPPFVVAFMTEQIDPQPTDRVLEIGTGSGYQAAVLSPLVAEVYTIEIVETLGRRAARTLKRLRYDNVHTKLGDGYLGWPDKAPFDKILVTCSPENVPVTLVQQLTEGGLMIVPVGERYQQTLYLFTKQQGKLVSKALLPTLFVPMTGEAEQARQVRPDPTRPQLVNGSFEERIESSPRPVGWHYLRQADLLVDSAEARDGSCYLEFVNRDPGRGSRVLQGFAVDGKKVTHLHVSLWVRGTEIRSGQHTNQLPRLVVTFYDRNRAHVGQASVGPWSGSFGWKHESSRLRVPVRTREAILRIGLLGAVGDFAVDGVAISAAE